MYNQVRVGDYVFLRQGFAINKNTKHYLSDEVTNLHLLRIGDMKDGNFQIYVKDTMPEKFIADENDIVYTRTGQVGLVFHNQHGVVHNNCFTVTSKDDNILYKDFLYYALMCKDFYLEANNKATGSAQPDLPHDAFKSIKIYLPPIDKQHRIADILSAYDDLIENNQKQISLLEEAAQRLYKEWFVDLRFPGCEHTRIIDGVPEGWERNSIDSIIKLMSGFAFKSKDFQENGKYKIITIKNVQDAHFDSDNVSFIDQIPQNMPAHCELKDGDILLSLTRNVGRTCIVIGDRCLLNQRVAKIQSEYRAFAYCMFRSKKMYTTVCNLANGAAQQNLSPLRVEKIITVLPDLKTLQRFENSVNCILEQIVNLHSKNILLKQARDRLLPKLMNGEIKL